MKLEDIITLAKAGYTPKQVKELLEIVETSPKVKEAAPITVEEAEHKLDKEPEVKTKTEEEDPIEALKKLLQ